MLTAEEFAECRHDLPDGGRWTELEQGKPFAHDPPDEAHGNAVLNLSKLLATDLHGRVAEQTGYACFELGLIVARGPDVVRFPAVSFFTEGDRFAMLDEIVTENCPKLVIEIASTNTRRREANSRVEAYHAFGIEEVWVLDSIDKTVHICRNSGETRSPSGDQQFTGKPILPELITRPDDLFAPPEWWSNPSLP
jgi:Uma2 family endonuclease